MGFEIPTHVPTKRRAKLGDNERDLNAADEEQYSTYGNEPVPRWLATRPQKSGST